MPHSCELIVQAAYCITQNEKREIMSQGALAIAEGRIVDLGPATEILEKWQAEQVLDLGNSMLLPGLVNTHTHCAMTLLRGLADDLTLMEWLEQYIFPVEAHLSPEMVRIGTLLGCAEMIRTGTTSLVDMYMYMDSAAEIFEQSGLRVLFGECVPSPVCPSFEQALPRIRAQIERWKGHPRISVGIMPHSVYTTSDTLLEQCRDLAHEYSLPLHIHLSENADESALCMKMHGKRPVPYCDDLGLLGPQTLLAHVVDVTPEEVALLARRGVRIAHNPTSNMKLASGISPVPDMLEQGLRVGLGTDGAASNNTLNMFQEMRMAALLHKIARLESTAMPAQAVLDMGTRNGAMWNNEIGQLRVGFLADMIALDLDAPHMQPVLNPLSQLVYAASGHETRMTMVQGKILYLDGEYLTLDMDEVRAGIQQARDWLDRIRGKKL